MLQELLYLGLEQRLRRLFSSLCVKTYIEQLQQFQDAKRAMIVKNAENHTANQKKALKVRIISGRK
jgi:hypothetical protein